MINTILLIIGMVVCPAFAQECTLDEDCDDGFYCNGSEYCDELMGECRHIGNPCNDGNDCTDDSCDEGLNECTNACNAVAPTEPCCSDSECVDEEICQAGGVINIGDFWANCGDVGVKIHICLKNLNIPVGGFQMDLCENPLRQCAGMSDLCEDDDDCLGSVTGKTYDVPCVITGADPDCLVCVECEMTERSTMFDCVVKELENGCCRVILFSKNPGGLINPGECDIGTIVYEIRDDPECCNACIEVGGENIVVTDEYGYQLASTMGGVGSVCPFQCGDVEPADDPDEPGWDCGDGDVDVFDFMEMVDFSLNLKTPDSCQAVRADVPIGTPPICIAPDGVIDALDLMVINGMLLDRQDCCSYYSDGTIY